MTWKPYRRDKLEDTEEWPKLKKVVCVSVCKRQTDGLIDQFHANVGLNHAHGDWLPNRYFTDIGRVETLHFE